jgi:hypothetical protein
MIEIIIVKSGIETTIEGLPQQFVAQQLQRKSVSKDQIIEEALTKIFVDNFDFERSKKVAFDAIDKHYDTSSITNIVQWLESPLGKRLLEAELHTIKPESQPEIARYLADLQTNPPSQERIQLIQEFEESAELTTIVVALFEAVARDSLMGIREISDNKAMSEEEIDQQINAIKAMITQVMWQQMILLSHYAYRNFTEAEIRQYIQYLDSDIGKVYKQMSITCYGYVLNDFFESVKPKIRERAKNLIGDKKST